MSASQCLVQAIPEFHHLAHRGGDATGIHMASVAFGVFRALAIPREVLVPGSLAERVNYSAGLTVTVEATCLGHGIPFGHDVGRGNKVVFLHIMDFFLEAVQRERKAFRYVVWVKLSRSGIGENGFHAVVASHDDEAFATCDVEGVIVSRSAIDGDTGQLQLYVSIFLAECGGAQELGTEFLGLLLINWTSHQATEADGKKA